MNRRRLQNKIKEAGDMIASQPGPYLAPPTLIDMVGREVEKLRDSGRISPLVHARSQDLIPILRTSIMNIYGGRVNGLEQAVAFLLKQARRGVE